MKYVILCDELPEKCEKCMFFGDGFNKTDVPNHFELVQKCMLGATDKTACPLTPIKTMFVDDEEMDVVQK